VSIVFFDFETGGVHENRPNIQLAAIAVDCKWNELATFEQKIQFDESAADPEALRINHYDPEVWKRDAKPSSQVAASFATFLKPYCCVEKISKRGTPYYVARLAGHNAASFDGPRLRRMFEECGMFLPAEMFIRDTLQRALWWFYERGSEPKNLRLTGLAEHFGIPADGAHDALADVRLSIAITRAMSQASVSEVAA